MNHYQIVVMVGSLRRDSFNRKLATAVVKLAPLECSFKQLQISDLSPYNQDDDANLTEPVKGLKGEIAASQGLFFVTPEYNRSIPGVLKNTINHASRLTARMPGGQGFRCAGGVNRFQWHRHGAIASTQRSRVSRRAKPALGQPEAFIHVKEEFFDGAGNIGRDSREFLQN